MKVYDGFHPVHFESVRLEKLTGHVMSKEYSGIGSTQKIYMFSNGYGASVVQGFMSMGLPELAVLHFNKPVKLIRSKKKRHKKKLLSKAGGYSLSYSTPITNDVKRYTDNKELQKDLNRLSKYRP
ncbi:hypothetical protein [Bacillus licheniformis]|uniref:hypothetical protein n=1 Tax=Bacillus licheniformis TaxID=1402 RepID=UPI00237CAF5D|nr:hypothetical protein [Bacillus licheniformis]MDE1381183.1 hypothetical protein [Bacillus licheniformis]